MLPGRYKERKRGQLRAVEQALKDARLQHKNKSISHSMHMHVIYSTSILSTDKSEY